MVWWMILRLSTVLSVTLSVLVIVVCWLFHISLSSDVFMLIFMALVVSGDLLRTWGEDHLKKTVMMEVTTIMDRGRLCDYLVTKMIHEGVPEKEARRLVDDMVEEANSSVRKE